MGISALTSRASGAKHKERLKNYHPLSGVFFTRETSTRQSTSERRNRYNVNSSTSITCRNTLGT